MARLTQGSRGAPGVAGLWTLDRTSALTPALMVGVSHARQPKPGMWRAEDTLTIVRLVVDEQSDSKFWGCPWCNYARDGPSPLHAHFERRHAAILSQASRVAYLRCCTDKHGAVRAFLSGPTIGKFRNPRETVNPTLVSFWRCGLACVTTLYVRSHCWLGLQHRPHVTPAVHFPRKLCR